MHMNKQQFIALRLSGTVAIPSPFPETGMISIVTLDERCGFSDLTRTTNLLRVEHRVSPRVTIVRCISVEDVSAVFVPRDCKSADMTDGEWFLNPESFEGDWQRRGIVYVRENAQLFMQVEVGMTAAESVEYYPPMPSDRSAAHPTQGGFFTANDVGCVGDPAPCIPI